MELKRLILGAGLTAALFGGIAAPVALANETTPPVDVCTADVGAGPSDAGEGIIGVFATDDSGTHEVCSFTASGATIQGAVASLNEWRLVATDSAGAQTILASQGNVLDTQTPPTVQIEATPAAGSTVSLEVVSACDPSEQGCGANVQYLMGASS